MQGVTVVGGGLAGLVAATECAERGAKVQLFEARSRLGGRAWSTRGQWTANYGAHAVYAGGALWEWLGARGLNAGFARGLVGGLRFRWRGKARRTPPLSLIRAVPVLRRTPPVDEDFRGWITRHAGPSAAAAASGLAGALTFDHDPGRFSAAFVAPRIRRILLNARPITRYPVGGWGAMVAAIAQHARDVGVRIEICAPVDVLPDGPVIVAVQPPAARKLLGTAFPDGGTRAAILDLGLRGAPARDAFIASDLDEAAFAERFSGVDSTVAPARHALIQAFIGLRPDEALDDGVKRIERALDPVWPRWREREVWRRRAAVQEATGALDLPGSTWTDRPAIEQSAGVWICGDWVASPGHLSEVAVSSAVRAAELAIADLAVARSTPSSQRDGSLAPAAAPSDARPLA